MNKKGISLLFTALSLISIAAAPAAIDLSKQSIIALAESEEPLATSIADSNVYWDLYYTNKDKWLENWNSSHPETPLTEFNPFFLTPNCGNYHGGTDKAKLLMIYPYMDDIYLYTWLNTQDVTVDTWDGTSIQVIGTTNVNFSETTGYLDEGHFQTYNATLVNTFNKSDVSSANYLAKWVIHDAIDGSTGQDFYRFKVSTMYLTGNYTQTKVYLGIDGNVPRGLEQTYQDLGYTIVRERVGDDLKVYAILATLANTIGEFECGDEIIYTVNQSYDDFNYHYTQPDHIQITSKKVGIWLSGIDRNSIGFGNKDFVSPYEYDSSNYNPIQIPNLNHQGTNDAWITTGIDYYRSYDENTYCFFNLGESYIDNAPAEEAISKISSIDYSFYKTTYTHVSKQNHISFLAPVGTDWLSGAYKYRYDNQFLNGDAHFEGVSTVGPITQTQTSTYDHKVTNFDHNTLIWWFPTVYEYRKVGIIDCSGNTNLPEGDSTYDSLRQFALDNRSYDSNGDGIKDSQYRWAFLVDEDTRTSTTVEAGQVPYVNTWWKSKTVAHEVSDTVILSLVVQNDTNLNFDLLAMDVNTPTTFTEIITVGNFYTIFPKWISDTLSAFDQLFTALKIILAVLLVLAVVIGISYIIQPFIAMRNASKISKSIRKSKKDK